MSNILIYNQHRNYEWGIFPFWPHASEIWHVTDTAHLSVDISSAHLPFAATILNVCA